MTRFSSAHLKSVLPSRRTSVVIAMLIATLSCAGDPPFNSYDPPPTFAIRYVAGDSTVIARFAGAQLNGTYVNGSVHPNFTTEGNRRDFNLFFPFGQYTVISDGRWPALWNIVSIAGCGVGTPGQINVMSKMISIACQASPTGITVQPPTFPGNAPPPFLTAQFAVASTPVDLYIVDANESTILASVSTMIDSNGTAQIATPALPEGSYYVVADFNAGGTEGAQGSFSVSSAATIVSAGSALYPGQSVTSPNGQWLLLYQPDGNFVLYNSGVPYWAIDCWAQCTEGGYMGFPWAPAGYATMQTDGNLVVYNGDGNPVWSTWTYGNAGAYLAVRDDGALIVYGPDNSILWQR